jgi:hypothetical protein
MDQAFIGSCASTCLYFPEKKSSERRSQMAQVLDVADVARMIASRVNVDNSGCELYPIPCVQKRTGKMVRVAKRLYHLLLKYFYHPRYDDAVCAYPKVYPNSLSLSREVYPIFVRFPFIQKYQHDNEAVSCQTICDKVSHGNKLDILSLTDQGEVYIV